MGFLRKTAIIGTGGLRRSKPTQRRSGQRRPLKSSFGCNGRQSGQQEQQQRLQSRADAQRASIADELSKLAALRDQGVLTEEEFAAQKARLLGNANT
jgi:hypothetical protein